MPPCAPSGQGPKIRPPETEAHLPTRPTAPAGAPFLPRKRGTDPRGGSRTWSGSKRSRVPDHVAQEARTFFFPTLCPRWIKTWFPASLVGCASATPSIWNPLLRPGTSAGVVWSPIGARRRGVHSCRVAAWAPTRPWSQWVVPCKKSAKAPASCVGLRGGLPSRGVVVWGRAAEAILLTTSPTAHTRELQMAHRPTLHGPWPQW